MNNCLPLNFLCRLAFATAISLSVEHSVSAQTTGGDFKPSMRSPHRQIDKQTMERPLLGGHNALPFRSKEASPLSQVSTSPLQTNAVTPFSGRRNNQAESTLRPTSTAKPVGAAGNNSFVAKTVSYGKPKSPVSAQQIANESRQDKNDGSNFVQKMPQYVDLNCSVKFIDDIRLPAKETGVIKTLDVKEGDFVPSGKIVGRIDDEMYRQMFVQAEMRYKMALDNAQDETAKQAAKKKYGVASIEATKARKLAASGSKSDSERLMAEYSEQLAELEIIKAELEMKKAQGEAELELARIKEVETRIQRHVLQSDFDAYVIEIFKKPQEFVNIGEEVMRIARMDKLWVQGIVDIRNLNPHEAMNRTVTVTVPLARGETTTFEGKIVNVALERQSSQHYMVKAEIKNRPVGGHWVLQPFSEVEMRIHLDKPASGVGAVEAQNVKR